MTVPRTRLAACVAALVALICTSALTVPSAVGLDPSAADRAMAPTCLGHEATIVGSRASETISSETTHGRDVVVARGGDDSIYTKGGGDIICAGKGQDTVNGYGGDDRILTSQGKDMIYGDTGDDRVRAGQGRDTLYGDEGRNYLNGGSGRDKTNAYTGHNRCVNIERVRYRTATCRPER